MCKGCKCDSEEKIEKFTVLRIEEVKNLNLKKTMSINDVMKNYPKLKDPKIDIQESITHFYGQREVKDIENMKCEKCGKEESYWEKEKITKWPETQMVYPNLWDIKKIGDKFTEYKKPHKIDYKDGRLNLGEGISEGINKVEYELCGSICHIGSMDKGHYYTWMEKEKGQWNKINDKKIEKIKTEIKQIGDKRIYLPPKDDNACLQINRKINEEKIKRKEDLQEKKENGKGISNIQTKKIDQKNEYFEKEKPNPGYQKTCGINMKRRYQDMAEIPYSEHSRGSGRPEDYYTNRDVNDYDENEYDIGY